MSLAGTVLTDFNDPEIITLSRNTEPEQIVNGHQVKGKVEQFQVEAVVQPIKPHEMLMFEEGDRVRQSYKLYTEDKLQIADPKTKIMADVIVYDDTAFEIVSSEKWVGDDFTFYKSIARRIDSK